MSLKSFLDAFFVYFRRTKRLILNARGETRLRQGARILLGRIIDLINDHRGFRILVMF